MKKIYIAAPLFSKAELNFNKRIKDILMPHFDVFLPQEDGDLLVDKVKSGENSEIAKKRIFVQDTNAVKACDCLLIVLDGRTIDEGASFELGYAFALNKVCVGFQSDPRRLLPSGNNPMIDESLVEVVTSFNELAEWAKRYARNLLSFKKVSNSTNNIQSGKIRVI